MRVVHGHSDRDHERMRHLLCEHCISDTSPCISLNALTPALDAIQLLPVHPTLRVYSQSHPLRKPGIKKNKLGIRPGGAKKPVEYSGFRRRMSGFPLKDTTVLAGGAKKIKVGANVLFS
jgi:hypothetical protein